MVEVGRRLTRRLSAEILMLCCAGMARRRSARAAASKASGAVGQAHEGGG
jgi:hypothetical protein